MNGGKVRAGSPRPFHIVAGVWLVSIVGVVGFAVLGGPVGGSGTPTGGFERVATFDVTTNETIEATDVAFTGDGDVLVYTDAVGRRVGFVDIADPARPIAAGSIELSGVPTDVQVVANHAFVAIDRSSSSGPAGELAVVDLRTRRSSGRVELRGEPAGLAVSSDGSYVAVAVANRSNDAPGRLVVVHAEEVVDAWTVRDVSLLGLASDDANDPEPDGVAINGAFEAVVTLPSNNHVVVVDLVTAEVLRHWPAGSTVLRGVDVVEDRLGDRERGIISLDTDVERDREPTGVVWIDDTTLATADEGAGKNGGGRGVTWFEDDGKVTFGSGSSLEWAAVRVGQFDEREASERGIRPAAVAVGTLGERRLLVVTAEKANLAAVYDVASVPRLLHVLPTGDEPGDVALSDVRGVMAVAAHGREDGQFPSMITLYRWTSEPVPPWSILSGDDADGRPIPWSTLSGLAGDPHDEEVLWAVNDGYLAEAALHRIELGDGPARITDRIVVRGSDGRPRLDLDVEGVAALANGAWLASEGRPADARPNLLLRIDDDGTIVDEIVVPAIGGSDDVDFGIEGVAVDSATDPEFLYVAFQRALPGDPAGRARLGRYDLAAGRWSFALYPLDAATAGETMGIADLALLPDGRIAVLERDNLGGPAARVKRVYGFDPALVSFAPPSSPLTVVAKEVLADALPMLERRSIWTPDNVEGLGVTADGRLFVVSDNDGLDSAIGQTVFAEIPWRP